MAISIFYEMPGGLSHDELRAVTKLKKTGLQKTYKKKKKRKKTVNVEKKKKDQDKFPTHSRVNGTLRI